MIGLLMHSVLHAFTHSVVWASVITSTFVALITTLLVEYFAKPRLEARKERILDKSRQRRNAINNFRRAINLANKLLALKGQPSEMVSLMDDHIKRSATDLQEYMFTAFEFIEAPQPLGREWEYTVSSMHAYCAVPSAMWPSVPDDFWEKFEATFNQMRDFCKLFRLSRWRPTAQTQTHQEDGRVSCAQYLHISERARQPRRVVGLRALYAVSARPVRGLACGERCLSA
jgi:hypothetical protein